MESFFTVNGIETQVADFIMGSVFVWRQPPPGERPDITSSEWFITPPVANGTMTVSTSTDAYNYLRFTDDYVFMTAQRLGYAAALGVGVSAIQFGYAVTAIDYTPTNVPEPSTVLLSGLGVLALLGCCRRCPHHDQTTTRLQQVLL